METYDIICHTNMKLSGWIVQARSSSLQNLAFKVPKSRVGGLANLSDNYPRGCYATALLVNVISGSVHVLQSLGYR